MYQRPEIIKEADGFMSSSQIGRVIIERNEGTIVFGNVNSISTANTSTTAEGAGEEMTGDVPDHNANSKKPASPTPQKVVSKRNLKISRMSNRIRPLKI